MTRIEFELNVPSGKMVFADFLPGFRIFGSFDLNLDDGLIRRTMAMARIGCAHGFVGNSCPGVYRLDDKRLIVTSEIEPKNVAGDLVGRIITDLWWYSFADAEEYERRRGAEKHSHEHIDVPPGVYKFSHSIPPVLQDEYGMVIYATITWVREPDPPKDYLAESRASNFTAGQVIGYTTKQWPDLFSDGDAVMRVANHIFCTIGGGGDWHPNGFIQHDPDMPRESAELVIPEFNKPFRWSQLSEHSALVRAAKGEIYLNTSFAALAKNVAHCIATYGSERYPDDQAIAGDCLEKLESRYP